MYIKNLRIIKLGYRLRIVYVSMPSYVSVFQKGRAVLKVGVYTYARPVVQTQHLYILLFLSSFWL